MSAASHPLVLEINTRCWLHALQCQADYPVTLGQIPDEILQRWAEMGFTHIWLMGIWHTGTRSRKHALEDPALRVALDQTLPEWKPQDIGGSPYALAGYGIPPALGGDAGLRQLRESLHQLGLGLMLDFVPNHVGLDHPWLREHPEYFVQSPVPVPGTFQHTTPSGPVWIAHGRDPNFPPWTDTAQLDYRRKDTQQAVGRALRSVAQRCDGLRCDMAMLLLRDVFRRNWQSFASPVPEVTGEPWSDLLQGLHPRKDDFLLLAECYWGLESRLQDLGFDYTYDKTLYDLILSQNPVRIQSHLLGVGPTFVASSAHFLENHDEPPIASLLETPQHRAAALATFGLPGLRLLHDSQLLGTRTQLPVQLRRRPVEPSDPAITNLYRRLLATLKRSCVGHGQPDILPPRPAWPGNHTHQNFLLVQWLSDSEAFDLVVVNFSPHRSQCYVGLSVAGLENRNWLLRDRLGKESYERFGDDLRDQGLYLDVPPHAAQLFQFTPQR